MKHLYIALALAGLVSVSATGSARADGRSTELASLQRQFRDYAGVSLVFTRSGLPTSSYYDSMHTLATRRRVVAARIALREVKKYPRGALGKMGLRSIGIFDALVSKKGDGFRPFNRAYRGYLYYGLWNGSNAIVAAYYTKGQLPLTLHHEIFHHIDATRKGKTSYGRNFSSDDARFARAIAGRERYPAPALDPADLRALQRKASGHQLQTAVSNYARKAAGEDQAETARYLMANLPDALVQVAERSKLAGSQRLLHVIAQYQRATGDAVDFGWLVDVALGRQQRAPRSRRALASRGAVAYRRMRTRIQPRKGDTLFTVWGAEDARGINHTLRRDVRGFGAAARRLTRLARNVPGGDPVVQRSQLQHLRLLARYYQFIASRWHITSGTRRAFDDARTDMQRGLPASARGLRTRLAAASYAELASLIGRDGVATGRLLRVPSVPRNPYSYKVGEVITNPVTRAAILRVQPAAVRLDNGSGVSIGSDGVILTAGHVVSRLGAVKTVRFPDGRRFRATTIAYDKRLDLAVLKISGVSNLPSAPLASAAPAVGARVIAIGQPGRYTPSGQPTNYKPWHVSVGRIRGFASSRLASQRLGGTKHDAWTYWGHSGSPLFDARGRIVALHNSWDSTTAMRHAVTYEAIIGFLTRNRISFTRR